ncbi:hypothetical protein H0H92_006018 [Tricholoma furcatifolium]|nr:hypothetical protein H0H92_006018 [Tricholoma furcatifolium]
MERQSDGNPAKAGEAHVRRAEGVLTNSSAQHDSKAANGDSGGRSHSPHGKAQAFANNSVQRMTGQNNHRLIAPIDELGKTRMATGENGLHSLPGHRRSVSKHSTGTIGQGDPVSMILYLFYNADLFDIPKGRRELALGFVDDAALVTSGKDLNETSRMLQEMMS